MEPWGLFYLKPKSFFFQQSTNNDQRRQRTNEKERRGLGSGHRRLVHKREGAARPWPCPRCQRSSSTAGRGSSCSWAAMEEDALELAPRVWMAMERVEEVRKRLRGRLSIHFKMAGAWDTRWQPSAMVGAQQLHRGRVGISSSMWPSSE